MKNQLLALLGFILLSTPLVATAQEDIYDGYRYIVDVWAITITGYYGPGGDVTIPDYFPDPADPFAPVLPVTSIWDGAFRRSDLTSVTISWSVTNIGDYAFEYCTRLTNVTILSGGPISIYGVNRIGTAAFRGCTSLTSVTISDSFNSIGLAAFSGCISLMAISVDAFNSTLSSLDGVLFNESQTALIAYPGGKGGSYPIPDTVTSMTYLAFDNCTSLTNVTIPGSVTNIGYQTFATCTNLTGVFCKGNAPSFGGDTFIGATNVTVYYLPRTAGWGTTFAGRRAVLWNPLMQTSGLRPAGFSFNITGTADIPIVVEACTNLGNASWVPLQSLSLTNGAVYFSDGDWTNYPGRIYRIRSP
jgi:hypothetical protein